MFIIKLKLLFIFTFIRKMKTILQNYLIKATLFCIFGSLLGNVKNLTFTYILAKRGTLL